MAGTNARGIRERFLGWLGQRYKFDLRGDLHEFAPLDKNIKISCIINFYGRLNLLAGILYSLVEQDFPKEHFEVILVEDRGGTPEGRAFCESFSDRVQIVYHPLDHHFGHMGYSRNFGLSKARGEFTLFLDDDTVILQNDFLDTLVASFISHPDISAIMPHGEASYALINDRYDFHDPFFMTSRCTAYRREVLRRLGGFMSSFIGQEDVEFVIRFLAAGFQSAAVPELRYRHPPLIVPNLTKPMAVGSSFYAIRKRYPLLIWLLAIINCSRHFPLIVAPSRKLREMGRFGLGFFWGILTSPFRTKAIAYR